jgi:hypothetical protein
LILSKFGLLFQILHEIGGILVNLYQVWSVFL